MKRMKFIGFSSLLFIAAACGSGSPDYDATGTFETTEVTRVFRSNPVNYDAWK